MRPCEALRDALQHDLVDESKLIVHHYPQQLHKFIKLYGVSSLACAAKHGHIDIVKFLASLPIIDVNVADNCSRTPIFWAAQYGHLNAVRFLASLPNTKVNATDRHGWTPMHCAARFGHVDVVRFLA